MGKRYIAILSGKLQSDGDFHIIDTYMKRQEESIIIRCVSDSNDEASFRAVTKWRLLFANDHISVVEAIPITGRTHQLRVHFAHIGHPILGDDVYGIPDKYIDRHALHAAVLSLPLPYGDEITEFISLPPEDMLNAANEYGCNLKKLFEEHFKN